MSSQRETYLRALKLFNEKADKLLQSMFVKFIQEKKKFTVRYNAKKGEPVRLIKLLPDEHAVDEFVLTFRFFIQDNEDSSFRNMTHLYEELPISQSLKDEFFDLAERLNEFLDSEPQIKFKIFEEASRNRKIMEVFIYGNIAHVNLSKKKIFDEWKKNTVVFPLLEFQFNSILETILRAIQYAKNLNEKVINELS